MTTLPDEKYKTVSFAAYCKDDTIRENSSSGGIFCLIAQRVIDQGGLVFGAAFDENGEVIHRCCTDKEDLKALMQSKYVQSSINHCFTQIIEALKSNRTVLFCGTPCQVNGLLSLLSVEKVDRNRLVAIDFICHGVPSRKIWRDYLEQISAGRKITKISFRDKTNGWLDYSTRIMFADGSDYLMSWKKDIYMRGFIRNLFLRPICYECPFRGVDRSADITLGDFWSIQNLHPEMFDNKGISIIMAHNDRGMKIIKELWDGMNIWPVENAEIIKHNIPITQSVPYNPRRGRFFKWYRNRNQDISKWISICLQDPILVRIRRKIKRYFRSGS